MKGGLPRLIFFFKSDILSCKSSLFFNFTGLLYKEGDVPQNDCEKDPSTEPIAAKSLFALSVEPKTKFLFAAE